MENSGNAIRTCRKAAKMTQRELGNALGVDHTMISRYENGRELEYRTYKDLKRIFTLHNVPVALIETLRHAGNFEPVDDGSSDVLIEHIQHSLAKVTPDEADALRQELQIVTDAHQTLNDAKLRNIERRSARVIKDLEQLRRQHELRNHRWLSKIDIELANAHYGVGRFTLALTFFEQVLWRAEEYLELEIQANVLQRMGDTLRRLGNWDEALDRYRQAEAVYAKLNDTINQTTVVRKRAGVHLFRGKPYEAEPLCEDAIKICHMNEDTHGLGKTLQHLAWVCYMTGRWDQGIRHAEQALRFVDEPWERAKALRYLGDANRIARNKEDALVAYLEANEILENLIDERDRTGRLIYSLVQLGLGKLYLKIDGHELDAGRCFNLGLAAQTGLREDFRLAEFLGEQGVLLTRRGSYVEAELKLHQAAKKFRDLGNDYLYANVLVAQCQLLIARGKGDDLFRIHQLAKVSRQMPNERGVLNFHLARIEFFVGKAHLSDALLLPSVVAWSNACDLALDFNPLAMEELVEDIVSAIDVYAQTELQGAKRMSQDLRGHFERRLDLDRELGAKQKGALHGGVRDLTGLSSRLSALSPTEFGSKL